MARWQMVAVGGGDRLVYMYGTDSATLQWLVSQVQERDPQAKTKETHKDADGHVYDVSLELSRGRDAVAMQQVLKRLLCDQGWEPYSKGFKRQA